MADTRIVTSTQERQHLDAQRQLANRRIELREELADAIQRDELYLEYQPVVSLEHGPLSGVEALVRWQRSSGEVVIATELLPRCCSRTLLRTG